MVVYYYDIPTETSSKYSMDICHYWDNGNPIAKPSLLVYQLEVCYLYREHQSHEP